MDIKKLIDELTLEEKAGLCSGKDAWLTKAVERLDIPAIRTCDGPHGVRLQEWGKGKAEPAVCFPTGCASAASFDRGLLRRIGEALGQASQAMGVQVLLGPGVNIKRSPLCGRNFEYFSEDPLLAGEMGASFVNGLQSRGVGASVKHFFANNQEHRRMDSSSEADERTLREIYLSAFERVVKRSKPWTIMASYNKINGVPATENSTYLNGILRGEWGFDGVVVSDWGATYDRVAAVAAGTDLTMPSATNTDAELVKAVKDGLLDEKALDNACENILKLVFKATAEKRDTAPDLEGAHTLAREAAAESVVLLKNEGGILPLKAGTKVAFIGAFAKTPRYQGGGSSHINSFRVTNAFDEAQKINSGKISYAQGYSLDQNKTDMALMAEAVEAAKNADTAVVFAGLTEKMESEGFDRPHMRMPENHNELIAAICAVQPNTVVVLYNGAPVEMPWAGASRAILEAYLGGQAIGEASVDVLFGKTNPSGRLPESFPFQLEDNPSYLYFRGENGVTHYGERVFVGYRYYETKKMPVRYPFGYGLSYTSFAYGNLCLEKESMREGETLTVKADVTNTGEVEGKTVVQLYVAPPKKEMIRPLRELRDFEKVSLKPGETKTVTFILDSNAFAYWDTDIHGWAVESGGYAIQIGTSAHDIVLEKIIHVEGKRIARKIIYTPNTIIADFITHPIGAAFWESHFFRLLQGFSVIGLVPKELLLELNEGMGYQDILNHMNKSSVAQTGDDAMFSMLNNQPISFMLHFVQDINRQEFSDTLAKMNS